LGKEGSTKKGKCSHMCHATSPMHFWMILLNNVRQLWKGRWQHHQLHLIYIYILAVNFMWVEMTNYQ